MIVGVASFLLIEMLQGPFGAKFAVCLFVLAASLFIALTGSKPVDNQSADGGAGPYNDVPGVPFPGGGSD